MSEPPGERLYIHDPAGRFVEQARALMEVGRYEEAVRVAQQAVAADPESLEPRCLLSLAFIRLGRLPDALRAAEGAVALAPDDEWPHRLRAIALLNLNRKKEALQAALTAVELAPDTEEALYVLVQCQLGSNKHGDARATAELLREIAPESAMAHEALGDVALAQKRWRDAEVHYREALRLNPEDAEVMNNLGVVIQRQGRKREAIDYFHNAARLNPQQDVARENLAQSARGYIWGGLFAFVMIMRFARAWIRSLPEGQRDAATSALVAVFIGGLIVFFLVKRNRERNLHPSVTMFLADESRRTWTRRRRELPVMIGVAAGSLTTVFWTFYWIMEGPVKAGLTSWLLGVYVLVVGGTVGSIGYSLWSHWRSRRGTG